MRFLSFKKKKQQQQNKALPMHFSVPPAIVLEKS